MIAHSIYWSLQASKENACVADSLLYRQATLILHSYPHFKPRFRLNGLRKSATAG